MDKVLTTYSFDDYLREANDAQDLPGLFAVYLKTVKSHGLDRAIFSLITEHASTGDAASFGMMHNYPQDWIRYYSENDFKYIDPVMLHAVRTVESFRWDDIPKQLIINRKQRLCLNLGQEAGLYNGVCSPFRGINNELAGIALATSDAKDAFDGNIDLIHAYSNHFYIVYRRLTEQERTAPAPYLTDKEREVLRWVAAGKTNGEIADIVFMSEATVDFHLRNIYRKLDANSRVLAAIKAISIGLIHL